VSLAQRFERRLEGLVGSAFARVFKGQVEPVEIGTALQREAADRRNVMPNGQVMSPNRYRVTLSGFDYERLAPWEVQLTRALAELVQEHLDENSWTTIGDVEVYLARDDDLHTGVFGVASRMDSGAPPRQRPYDSLSLPAVGSDPRPVPANLGGGRPNPGGYASPAPRPGSPAPYGRPPAYAGPRPSAARYQPPQPSPGPQRPGHAALVVDSTGQRFELRPGSNVVGRGSDCDLQLLDQGVSRRHLDVQFDGVHATLYDLGSTNGTAVNGHDVARHLLRHGDVLRIGHTRLVFVSELA
jgi:hypothetical protein